MEGEGRFSFEDGRLYVGQLKQDLPEGEGRWQFADGRYYIGTFRQGQPQFGTLFTSDGQPAQRIVEGKASSL